MATPVSLEDRLLGAYASAGVETRQAEAAIQAIIDSPDITHPEVLAKLQTQLAQYNVDVTLLNALVRKAVGTVETLLRAS
nr:type III secretion system inner rod subunit SctI [Pseudomonas typographi]